MNVLFIGRTIYVQSNKCTEKRVKWSANVVPFDNSIRAKWLNLSQGHQLTVIARTNQPRFLKFRCGADFHLVPVLPIAFLDILWYTLVTGFLGLWLALRRNVRIIDAEDPVVSGFVSSGLTSLLRLLGREVKLLVHCHGEWEETYLHEMSGPFQWLAKGALHYVVKNSFSHADWIRAVTAYMKQKIEQLVPGKPIIIFPGYMDLKPFLAQQNKNKEKIALFVGTLGKRKAPEDTILAMAEVVKCHPAARLVIRGGGPRKKELEELVGKLGLTQNVAFQGFLSLAELAKEYAASTLLVFPTLSEGFGRVIVEANACGKPVITTAIGPIPELVTDGVNGFLVKPRNPKALAEKMIYLFDHPDKAASIGLKGRELVRRRYSEQSFYDHYHSLLATVGQGNYEFY
ncbi:MAG: glycosyltransferase family 4 protein [Candidatus Diapherotrites archaeon]|uniref:Glycosyltransferase family 4 protein n=1 Tax=Candidatus Iainarchaeum sp. TaxID=3101447 RepID=A0A8T4LA58_9ARCH|nr:glycosyltransferase family 4 protein [Candidatus Diapherotrites archaeon]